MKGVYDLLRGSFLTGEKAVKNWQMIVFIVGLLLIMIWSSHSVDAKVQELVRLNRKKIELKSIYVEGKMYLAKIKLESTVKKIVEKEGLKPLKNPPQKIIIKQN